MKKAWISALLAGAALSCGGGDFDPQNVVSGVRVLSSRADRPYAKPGDTVQVDLLVADGRADKRVPLQVAWIPFVCTNPEADLYYACFAQLLSGGSTGGAGAGGFDLSKVPFGIDISKQLPQGTSYSVTIPKDIVKARPGQPDPYGLVMLFNIACAGKIVLAEPDPSAGAAAVPIQCVDDAGKQVPPSDYVFGYTRVYAYNERTNANPILDGLTFDGKPVDFTAGITVDRCTAIKPEDCPSHKLGVTVPASSQEVNAGQVDEYGNTLNEIVWTALYADAGRFDEDVRLLYDARAGKAPNSDATYRPGARSGSIWVVVKDNRGGSTWKQVPVTVR